MIPPQDNNDAMFEHFLDGDEELAAALAAADGAEGLAAGETEGTKRGEEVLDAGLRFVQNLREMGE